MKKVEKKYNTHIVIKIDDLEKLDDGYQNDLDDVLLCLDEIREKSGREPRPKYLVVNLDEPYAEEVWGIILSGEREKQKHQGLPQTQQQMR